MTIKFLSRPFANFSVLLCFASALLAGVATTSTTVEAQGPEPATVSSAKSGKQAPAHVSWSNLPLSFEPNRGQTSRQAQWLSRGPDFTVFLAGHDAVLEMNTISRGTSPLDQPKITGAALRMNLLGSTKDTQSEGQQPLLGHANYFHGTDPANWQRDIPTFARVELPAVYPGVDLIYYGHNGHLEYDFVVSAGADPSAIRLGFEGAKPALSANGDLLLKVAGRQVTLDRPVAYQTVGGTQQPVEGSFAIAENDEVTFRLGAYDHSRQLTIDPVLIFDGAIGTGNNGDSTANGMTVDAAGEIILTGATRDTAFPTTSGVIQPTCGIGSKVGQPRCTSATDAFITKIAADGKSLVFSTYLSGTQYTESGIAVAVDAAGVIYAVGNTNSDDFPITTDAFQKLCSPIYTNAQYNAQAATCGNGTGIPDIYLVKINPAGSQILYGTFLGGTAVDVATGVAVDPAGNIYLSGITSSTNPPSPATGLGAVYPVTASAYQLLGASGNFSATLSKFSNDGHSLLYSTNFGSPSTANADRTYSSALAVGANGVVFLGGFTDATSLPTTAGTIKTTCDPVVNSSRPQTCLQDTGFVAAFDTTKSGPASLIYSTMIGPPSGATGAFSHTYVNGLLADASNDVFVTGSTLAYNFPTTAGAYQTSCAFYAPQGDCGAFAYLSKINPTGSAFLFSTYYGGPNTNDSSAGYAIATDAKGRVYLYGSKNGLCDLPVLNPVQTNCQGVRRVFVSAFAPDASKLLFGTEFGSPNGPEDPIAYNGLALDSGGNIYFGGLTRNVAFPTTSGTYTVPAPGGFQRPFFGKISPVLAPSITALTITPSTTITGQTVTFTASVTSPSQTAPAATGTVVLTNTSVSPASPIGTIQLGPSGTGTFTSSSLAVGTYSIAATYSSDATYDFSTSAVQTLTINSPASATVTLTIPAASVNVGSPVTFNVKVAGPQGSSIPTGTVYFQEWSTLLGSAVLANGLASYTTSALGIGTHNISINYTGDNTFSAGVSAAQNVIVAPATATVALTAPTTATPGASVTVSVKVTGSNGTPTGSVTFKDGVTILSTVPLASGSASYTSAAFATGSHSLTVSYTGDSIYGAATSSTQLLTVALLTPTVTLTAPATALAGASVALSASVTGTPGTPTGSVTFKDGTTVLSTVTLASGAASYSTSALAAGAHTITASYSGDTTFNAVTSAPSTVTISVAPAITFSASPASLTVTHGMSVTTVITGTPVGGYSGTVTFTCGTLPAGASCVFAPSSLTFSGNDIAMSTTLTFATSITTTGALQPLFGSRTLGGVLAALLLAPFTLRRKRILTGGCLLLWVVFLTGSISVLGLSGCGGSKSATIMTTAPGAYTVPVTVTAGSTTSTVNLSITVQ